ncbi:MAG: GEVED domain-containing protein [Bacteroidia bacterium]|nr:GEVED domain-containing protein [Bacteroidia bacterium]
MNSKITISIAKTFLLIGFITSHNVVLSQSVSYKDIMMDNSYNFYEVVDAANNYFDLNGKGKGSGFKIFERWRSENESKYFPSGNRSNVNHYLPQEAYSEFVESQYNLKHKTSFPNGWVELGPWDANNVTSHYSPGIGRVETFWVNPNDDKHMFIGSRSGGFWRTNDGGVNWENTTDFLVASGVPALAVNPNNINEVLISVEHGGAGYTHGIYRSTNGGATWSISDFNPTNLGWGGLGDNEHIYKIAYHPNVANQVFICSTKGLFVSNDNLKSWTSPFNGRTTDVDFHPTKNTTIYAYRYNSPDASRIKISTNGGNSFSNGGSLPNNDNKRVYLSISPSQPSHIYAASTNNVYKSTNEGSSFTALSNPNSSGLAFAVSDVNTNNMIYGYVDLFASTDGGLTFTQKTEWANQNDAYIHADLRIAQCINGTFYVGTDGYFAKSDDNGNTWTRLNDGTAIREFYAVGLGQGNYDLNMAGSQDNGSSILNKNGWVEWNGGDGMEAIVHPLNYDWMIGSWQYGTRNYTHNGGLNRRGCGNPDGGSGKAAWEAPFLQNPQNSMQVYHFSDTLYAGNNFGRQWQFKSDPNIGVIGEAAIAETDSNVIAIARNNQIRITNNGGESWTNIENGLPGYYVRDIAFDPRDENRIIVVYNRYQNDNKKVYISNDQGATWQNITYNLGNMPLRTVVIDHSDSCYIYVGGEIGVYYKSKSATQWTLYNNNLPNVTVKDLEIHYGSNTLRAATWGRGLWEYTLVGRNNFPSITHTNISNTPTDDLPKDGVDQYITSIIKSDQTLSEVRVLWNVNNFSLDSSLTMENIGDNTWKSTKPISSNNLGEHIYFKVIAKTESGNQSETYVFDYLTREFNYCIPATNGAGSDYINFVKLESIENSSDQEFYGDFTAQSTELELGKEYTIEVGMFYVFDQDSVTAWIDFNRDGEFTDKEQIIFTELNNTDKKATGLFTVPNEALTDKNLRLRVRSQYFTNPMSPCENTPGEVEDYTVRLKKPKTNGIVPNTIPKIVITPNPTRGIFEIKVGQLDNVQINIIDISGKIIYQQKAFTDKIIITTDLPQGSYLVQVLTSNGSTTKKLIVN